MRAESIEKIVKLYHENKLSHAYLLVTNNIENCLSDLKIAIKQINCNKEYLENCTKCNICNLINQNFLPSLIIIEPDGKMIKKEQILELKRKFSTKPIYTKENIYVIKNAEALNAASANTMLKFLEEPDEHIIGFFITSNLNNVIPTIRSRCEVIKAMYQNHELDASSIFDNENLEMLNLASEYLEKIEVEKKDFIMYNKSVLLAKISTREEVKKCFQIILIIYEEYFKNSLGVNNNIAKFKTDFLLNLSNSDLLKRISLVTKFLDDLNSNVNIWLLVDKFVIELGDING